MDESMTKTDAREALSAYIDGELPTDQAGALEALLASDQELATELQELRDVVSELGSLPQIEAPEGFFAAVMSRVEAGESGAVDGASEVVDFDAERRRIAAIREAADAAEEPEQTDNVVFGGWWIKGPAIVAAAALLVIGLGQIIVAPDQGPPSMMAAAPRASSSPALAAAPAPTGLATGDGIVDAGPAPLGLGDSSPEVAVGFAGSAAPPAPAARRSGIQVGRGSTQPAGVYAAEYELSDSEPDAEEEAVAGADGEMAPEPEPNLAEPADPDGVISAGAGAAPGGDMAFGLASSKAKASDGPKPDAAPAAGTLSVQAADGMRSLEAAVRARGWTIRYLGSQPRAVDFDGSVTSQSVEIAARGTDADLRGVLGGQGTLQMGAASPGSDGLLRVRLTVVHATGE